MFDSSPVIFKNGFKRSIDVSTAAQTLFLKMCVCMHVYVCMYVCVSVCGGVSLCGHELVTVVSVCSCLVFK